MFCSQCGKENPEGVKFCKYCGQKIVSVSEEKPVVAAQPAETAPKEPARTADVPPEQFSRAGVQSGGEKKAGGITISWKSIAIGVVILIIAAGVFVFYSKGNLSFKGITEKITETIEKPQLIKKDAGQLGLVQEEVGSGFQSAEKDYATAEEIAQEQESTPLFKGVEQAYMEGFADSDQTKMLINMVFKYSTIDAAKTAMESVKQSPSQGLFGRDQSVETLTVKQVGDDSLAVKTTITGTTSEGGLAYCYIFRKWNIIIYLMVSAKDGSMNETNLYDYAKIIEKKIKMAVEK